MKGRHCNTVIIYGDVLITYLFLVSMGMLIFMFITFATEVFRFNVLGHSCTSVSIYRVALCFERVLV